MCATRALDFWAYVQLLEEQDRGGVVLEAIGEGEKRTPQSMRLTVQPSNSTVMRPEQQVMLLLAISVDTEGGRRPRMYFGCPSPCDFEGLRRVCILIRCGANTV